MSDPKSFLTALIFALIMVICIIIDLKGISKSRQVKSIGALIFGICATLICTVALVFDIIQMVKAY